MLTLEAGTILIGPAESSHVLLTITDCDHEENWIRGTMEIWARPWRGACEIWFHMGELRQLAAAIDRLYRDLVGTAEFSSMESHLELTFAGDGKVHVAVSGRGRDGFMDGNSIVFRFDLDQTELPAIAQQLRIADPA